MVPRVHIRLNFSSLDQSWIVHYDSVHVVSFTLWSYECTQAGSFYTITNNHWDQFLCGFFLCLLSGFIFVSWPYPLHHLFLLPTGAVVSWVLLFLCFPDAQLLIAGPVGSTSPPNFTHSRVPTRGRITLCSHICLPNKGYQGGATTSGPETGCSDKLPLDWFVSGLNRFQPLFVLNHSEPVRTGLKP